MNNKIYLYSKYSSNGDYIECNFSDFVNISKHSFNVLLEMDLDNKTMYNNSDCDNLMKFYNIPHKSLTVSQLENIIFEHNSDKNKNRILFAFPSEMQKINDYIYEYDLLNIYKKKKISNINLEFI